MGTPAATAFQKSLFEFYHYSYLSNVTEVKNKANKLQNEQLAQKDFLDPFEVFSYCCFQKVQRTPKEAWHTPCKANNCSSNRFSGYEISIHTGFLFFFGKWGGWFGFFSGLDFTIFNLSAMPKSNKTLLSSQSPGMKEKEKTLSESLCSSFTI